jgi:hypothetical protein
MVFGVILAMGRGWGWVDDLKFETEGLKIVEVQNK